jgi:hypothetical protein
VDLTSDPHAWLRPYYIALKADRGLQRLAIPLRFKALCCAVKGEHPRRVAAMREWSPAAKQGILGCSSQSPTVRHSAVVFASRLGFAAHAGR